MCKLQKRIFEILGAALSGGTVDTALFSGLGEDEWEQVYKVLSQHGMAAVVADVLESLPVDCRPPKNIILKFISSSLSCARTYGHISAVVEKLGRLLSENGIGCLLLKGLSLADYYPHPDRRKFMDIDIYAPDKGEEIDGLLRSKGVEVDAGFYRHSHCHVSGLLVENHKCLLDLRGRKSMKTADADLKSMAVRQLCAIGKGGLYYPDPVFAAIFNLHHAMSHFIYEGISFKFLADWMYFLRKEKDVMQDTFMKDKLGEHSLLRFAAVMTLVSVHELRLEADYVPDWLNEEMKRIPTELEERFVADLFRSYRPVSDNIFRKRIENSILIFKAAWKPKEFLGQSALGFVTGKFLPILLGKNLDAD